MEKAGCQMNHRAVYPILAPRSRPHDRETEVEYFQRLAADQRGVKRRDRRTQRRARLRAAIRISRPHSKG
jgi:hypothetical protein